MKILAKITILLLQLRAGTALRHRRLQTSPPINVVNATRSPTNNPTEPPTTSMTPTTKKPTEPPTSNPTMTPTKGDVKGGKQKGKSPKSEELTEVPTFTLVPTSAPNGLDSKEGKKGKKNDPPISSPTIGPTSPIFQIDPSVTASPTDTPTAAPTKFDSKGKKGDTKESPSLSPTKEPKGSTTPKGAPEDLDDEDNTGAEPKGDAKGAVDDSEPKGEPQASGAIDDPEPEPKGSSIVEDTEPEPKGDPKGSGTDGYADPAPKGAPKGSGEVDETDPDPKGEPKGPSPAGEADPEPKGDLKGSAGNVFVPSVPTKKASPPVEVHMIGVKLASRKHSNNAAIVSTISDCSQGGNMVAKKLAFSSICQQDPTVCGLAGGTKKEAGKRYLKKSSCVKSSKKGSKKRYI